LHDGSEHPNLESARAHARTHALTHACIHARTHAQNQGRQFNITRR